MKTSEVLYALAEEFFNPVDGKIGIVVNEFTSTDEFISGERAGHVDAYNVILGTADYYDELEQEDSSV